ncbi:cytochrome P450 monooxygenase [Lepidopterella palustris CBS 459.81]|uniref:Cytochrome P450 monooxygenase n=1 Tax=Lepidopterella palustris CBS 459.81 TaxID=1314670 RepID=A0A8E2EEB5_9PEZI|nr:cytochrome P450 monooxygenase [Lepidopterella palustris CBS 459.81]
MAYLVFFLAICGLIYIHYANLTGSKSSIGKIPKAHWSVGILPAWILWIRFQQRENEEVQKAHERCGPIVRLGPKELSINVVEGGVKTVYGSYEKHNWYKSFWNLGLPNMFTFGDFSLHSERRRALSRIYSKTHLIHSEPLKRQNEAILYGRLTGILKKHAETGEPLEIFGTMLSTTMDIVTAFLFGLSQSSNFLLDVEQRNLRLKQYQGRGPYAFYAQELRGFWAIVEKLGFRLVPKAVASDTEEFEKWILGMCDGAQQKLYGSSSKVIAKTDEGTVYEQLSASLKSAGREIAGEERSAIASEMTDHAIAGHETSGIALTYLIYLLSRESKLQRALRDEVSPLFTRCASSKELPAFETLDQLPLLHACVWEVLRLYPPICGAQARLTPRHQNVRLGSYTHIPGGVRVSARAFCLHRNPDVYPEPHLFQPQRWLNKNGSVKKVNEAPEMYHWWWAFGSGGRVCLGNHFALHDIKVVVSFIYAFFETEFVSSGDMAQAEGYIGGPRGGNLMVKFKGVE